MHRKYFMILKLSQIKYGILINCTIMVKYLHLSLFTNLVKYKSEILMIYNSNESILSSLVVDTYTFDLLPEILVKRVILYLSKVQLLNMPELADD